MAKEKKEKPREWDHELDGWENDDLSVNVDSDMLRKIVKKADEKEKKLKEKS